MAFSKDYCFGKFYFVGRVPGAISVHLGPVMVYNTPSQAAACDTLIILSRLKTIKKIGRHLSEILFQERYG